MKVLMALVLVLILAGCAALQGGAGQTPAEETTANETEETTTLTGEGGFPQPPDSTLFYGGREVKVISVRIAGPPVTQADVLIQCGP